MPRPKSPLPRYPLGALCPLTVLDQRWLDAYYRAAYAGWPKDVILPSFLGMLRSRVDPSPSTLEGIVSSIKLTTVLAQRTSHLRRSGVAETHRVIEFVLDGFIHDESSHLLPQWSVFACFVPSVQIDGLEYADWEPAYFFCRGPLNQGVRAAITASLARALNEVSCVLPESVLSF